MSSIVSDENNPNVSLKPSNCQGGLELAKRRFGQEIRLNRRGLSVLDRNIVEAAQGCLFVVNKRPLTENHGVCETKPLNPAQKPITRRFASQISNTLNNCTKEPKKQKASVPSTNAFGDSIYVDEEENREAVDQPVPMFLESSEPNTNVDQTEEVEMEIEESIIDIDSCDAKNPLAVVDYVEEMYEYYRKMEGVNCASPTYMAQQSDINEKMRAILVDWLIEVHDKFELMKETLFLTVNIIDRFLSQQTVMRKKLQLVGLVAMLLACKYEEVCVPVVGDLILISDKAYTRKEILEMENLMLNKLQFNMSLPTPYVFLQRFLKAAQSNQKLELLSFFLIELALVEYEMLKFPLSMLAASAIFTAQCSIYGFKQWSRTCEWHSGYSEDQLLECSRLMVGYHQKAGTGRLTGTYRKYNTTKFKFTSKCEPAVFLLESQQQ